MDHVLFFITQERDRNRGLTVMEDTRNQVYVEGLKEHTVTAAEDVFLLMEGTYTHHSLLR